MKKSLFLSLLLLPAMIYASTNEFDLLRGFTFTGATNFSMSQLDQLVDKGKTATNKGMIIVSTTTPDTTNNTRYSNFLWLDIGYLPPKLKVYTQPSNLWAEIVVTNATVGDLAVTTAKLAALAVTEPKIASDAVIERTILAGAVTSNKIAASSITTDKLVDAAVSTSKLSNSAVTTAIVADSAITRAKLATDAVGGSLVVSNYGIEAIKLATNAVQGYSISNNVITTNKFETNTANLFPKGWAKVVGSDNSVIVAGNITQVYNTNSTTAMILFSPNWSSTNYIVQLTSFGNAGAGSSTNAYVSVQTVSNCLIQSAMNPGPYCFITVWGY